MKINKTLLTAAVSGCMLFANVAMAKPVGITPSVGAVSFTDTDGGKHTISRNQDNSATIHKAFTKTSRPCPPFCIQPTRPFGAAAVETISELDIINAARDIAKGDTTKLLIDSRTPVWTTAAKGGKIPFAVNIPFNTVNSKAVAKDPGAVIDILTSQFGVTEQDDVLNFSKAKTLYLYCNGLWCGQSPAAIRALLALGYPESKLKYYRTGMNAWHSLGLTTVH